MKKLTFICTVFLLYGLFSIPVEAKQHVSDICGTWELVEFNHGGGQVVINTGSLKRVKTITENKFVWVHFNSSDKVASSSAGGKYSIEGNTYSESIDYGSSFMKSYVRTISVFTYKIDGDYLTIEGKLGSGLYITEKWKKVNLPEAYKVLMDEHYNLIEGTDSKTIPSKMQGTNLPLSKSIEQEIEAATPKPSISASHSPLLPIKKEVADSKGSVNDELGMNNQADLAENYKLQNVNISNFKVFPNPASQRATLSFDVQESIVGRISLVDLSGHEQQVFDTQTEFEAGNHQVNIDINNVDCGIYMLTLKTANGLKAQRFIVKR